MEPPLCDCHGVPKGWVRVSTLPKGGYWRCLIRRREVSRKYATSAKGRATKQRWQKTDKGKKSLRKYQNSEKGLAVKAKHEESRIRIQAGGVKLNYRVPPETKHDIIKKLDDFRSQQREEFREEFVNVRIDKTVS